MERSTITPAQWRALVGRWARARSDEKGAARAACKQDGHAWATVVGAEPHDLAALIESVCTRCLKLGFSKNGRAA